MRKPGPARPVPRCRFVSPARLGPARSGSARRAARPVQVIYFIFVQVSRLKTRVSSLKTRCLSFQTQVSSLSEDSNVLNVSVFYRRWSTMIPWIVQGANFSFFSKLNYFRIAYSLFLEWDCVALLLTVSGGVTGGFGWVQTHLLSKKAPMRFSQIRRLFVGWGRGGGRARRGRGVEREKHELCQIVLNSNIYTMLL